MLAPERPSGGYPLMKRRWRSWVAILSAALMIGVGPGHAKQKDKDKHTVRMGELLFSAISPPTTGLRIEDLAPPIELSSYTCEYRTWANSSHAQCLKPTSSSNHFISTALGCYLKVINRRLANCFLEDAAEGQYTFDIREGVVPKELRLKAQDSRESRCTEHPDWGSIWHYRSEARIPIDDLPTQAQLTPAVVSPTKNVETPLGLKSQAANSLEIRSPWTMASNTVSLTMGWGKCRSVPR